MPFLSGCSSPTSGSDASAPVYGGTVGCSGKISEKDKKEIDALIAAGKHDEAIDKTVEVLEGQGFDLSKMKDGKPTYDSSMKGTYGTASREKPSKVLVGDAAFKDSSTLLTTIAHENRHAEQWDNPTNAKKMGSNARELEAYFVEIKNEDEFGVDKSMKTGNRSMAKKHYKNLTPEQQKAYKSEYEKIIGPVPK